MRNAFLPGIVLLTGVAAVLGFSSAYSAPTAGRMAKIMAMPVQVAVTHIGTLPLSIDALGTVTARKTVAITPRVNGLIEHVRFREGQMVKVGQVLDELDPRPYQVVVDQWVGQLMHDQALLDDARLDLTRYQGLLAKNSVAKQQVDTQVALVYQDEGTVLSDKAQLANARLQLEFSRVTAPVAGRVGLRLVDEGNVVYPSSGNSGAAGSNTSGTNTTGLVVITQTQPIDVIFAVPADQINKVMPAWQAGQVITVEAYDRNDKVQLATGRLLALDNQINTTTGTVNFKAAFSNVDNRLFPNEFVNVHLHLGDDRQTLLMPVAAIQTNEHGAYAYVVDANDIVHMRPIVLGPVSGETASVSSGLKAGEQVVIDGADRLRNGSKVIVSGAGNGALMRSGHGGHHHHADSPDQAGS